jgi:hypothetical protein
MRALPAALLAPRADGVAELLLGPLWADRGFALADAPAALAPVLAGAFASGALQQPDDRSRTGAKPAAL